MCSAIEQNKRVSMEFQDTPVTTVLQALADYQQLNLITANGVSGTINLRLVDVPWKQALAIILRNSKLSMELEGNVMMISPQQDKVVKQQQDDEKQAAQMQPLPLQTLTRRLQYADAQEVAKSLAVQLGTLLSKGGSVRADKRLNALLIRDNAEALTLVKNWLDEIDKPLEQVQLSAHIVTISNESLRELGVSWGLSSEETKPRPLRLNNFNVSLPLDNSAIALGFHAARISGRMLDLELTALEQENQVEIIASPRLVTAHQQMASIKQGTEIPYEVSSGANGATSIEFKEAVLGMEVTPKVLPDGHITLTLHISQNAPGRSLKQGNGEALAIDTQEIKTQVTVKDGETLVLGGIFQHQQTNSTEQVPGIAKIPVIGSLFKQQRGDKTRRELVIFITPTLIKS